MAMSMAMAMAMAIYVPKQSRRISRARCGPPACSARGSSWTTAATPPRRGRRHGEPRRLNGLQLWQVERHDLRMPPRTIGEHSVQPRAAPHAVGVPEREGADLGHVSRPHLSPREDRHRRQRWVGTRWGGRPRAASPEPDPAPREERE